MASMKLGVKPDAFERHGKICDLFRFCTNGLPSDVTVEIEEIVFHLHKFPLLSKSAVLEKLFKNTEGRGGRVIKQNDLPGGARAFELVVKFCYGVKFELTSSNVVQIRCAAEQLQMTEEVAEGNLIAQTEIFFNQVVLGSWKDTIVALQTCDDLLPHADKFEITKRCIDSLVAKVTFTDPNLLGWPLMEPNFFIQSPGGSVLWNGISTGIKAANSTSDWWYEDASSLSFPLYKRLISAMKSKNMKQESIAGSLIFYLNRYMPGLSRHQNLSEGAFAAAPREEEQRHILEEIDQLMPVQKDVVSTKILLSLLRTAIILKASPSCVSNLETRIGMQLDQADLQDLLFPTFAYSMEALYNVECVQRILDHFLATDQLATEGSTPGSVSNGQSLASPCLMPITNVAKLIDGYLAEVAPDINLKPTKFQRLASAIPEYARLLDDGLYRAIDIYLQAHPWLSESEKEQICKLIDCRKLSLEACTHAAQNERLPLRVVVQVLFFEQLQLRTSVAGCLLVSDNLDGGCPRPLRNGMAYPGEDAGCATAVRQNKDCKVGMDDVRTRVSELEKECCTMKQELQKLGRGRSRWTSTVANKLRFKMKLKMCSVHKDSVSDQNKSEGCSLARHFTS